ncbi:hypothetical protein BS78_05G112900 [Paspalum vaginatum]|nr:hypothetical protein BS78_05G112900 [Paspalum vaginatum]
MDNREAEKILQQMILDGMHDEENASIDTDVYLNLDNKDTCAPDNAKKDICAPKNANKDTDQSPSGSKKKSSRRGSTSMKNFDGRFIIEEVREDGQSLSPATAATKFVNYCGYLVRNHVPISFRTWRPTCVNDPHVVPKAQKAMLWDTVKLKFNILEELQEKVEDWDLKKMAILFQTQKKKLYKAFTIHEKMPDFKAFT